MAGKVGEQKPGLAGSFDSGDFGEKKLGATKKAPPPVDIAKSRFNPIATPEKVAGLEPLGTQFGLLGLLGKPLDNVSSGISGVVSDAADLKKYFLLYESLELLRKANFEGITPEVFEKTLTPLIDWLSKHLEALQQEMKQIALAEEKHRPVIEHGMADSSWVSPKVLIFQEKIKTAKKLLDELLNLRGATPTVLVLDLFQKNTNTFLEVLEQSISDRLTRQMEIVGGMPIPEGEQFTALKDKQRDLRIDLNSTKKASLTPSERIAYFQKFITKLESDLFPLTVAAKIASLRGAEDSFTMSDNLLNTLGSAGLGSHWRGSWSTSELDPVNQKVPNKGQLSQLNQKGSALQTESAYQEVLSLWNSGQSTEAMSKFFALEMGGDSAHLEEYLKNISQPVNKYGVGLFLLISSGAVGRVAGEVVNGLMAGSEYAGTVAFWSEAATFTTVHGLSPVAFGGKQQLFDFNQGTLANGLLWIEKVMLTAGMLKTAGAFVKGYMGTTQERMVLAARDQLVKEGTITANATISAASREARLIFDRVKVLQEGFWSKLGVQAGAFGAEYTGLTSWEPVELFWNQMTRGELDVRSIFHHTFSGEALFDRVLFLGAMKGGHLLADPMLKPIHEFAKDFAMQRHKAALEKLEPTLAKANESLQKIFTQQKLNTGEGRKVLSDILEALYQKQRILEQMPELRDEAQYQNLIHEIRQLQLLQKITSLQEFDTQQKNIRLTVSEAAQKVGQTAKVQWDQLLASAYATATDVMNNFSKVPEFLQQNPALLSILMLATAGAGVAIGATKTAPLPPGLHPRSDGSYVLKLMSDSRQEVTIGRTTDNKYQIEDLKISSRHLKIWFENGKFWIRDLGSTNGTYVNGTKITGNMELTDGASISLGGKTILFEIGGQKSSTQTPVQTNSSTPLGKYLLEMLRRSSANPNIAKTKEIGENKLLRIHELCVPNDKVDFDFIENAIVLLSDLSPDVREKTYKMIENYPAEGRKLIELYANFKKEMGSTQEIEPPLTPLYQSFVNWVRNDGIKGDPVLLFGVLQLKESYPQNMKGLSIAVALMKIASNPQDFLTLLRRVGLSQSDLKLYFGSVTNSKKLDYVIERLKQNKGEFPEQEKEKIKAFLFNNAVHTCIENYSNFAGYYPSIEEQYKIFEQTLERNKSSIPALLKNDQALLSALQETTKEWIKNRPFWQDVDHFQDDLPRKIAPLLRSNAKDKLNELIKDPDSAKALWAIMKDFRGSTPGRGFEQVSEAVYLLIESIYESGIEKTNFSDLSPIEKDHFFQTVSKNLKKEKVDFEALQKEMKIIESFGEILDHYVNSSTNISAGHDVLLNIIHCLSTTEAPTLRRKLYQQTRFFLEDSSSPFSKIENEGVKHHLLVRWLVAIGKDGKLTESLQNNQLQAQLNKSLHSRYIEFLETFEGPFSRRYLYGPVLEEMITTDRQLFSATFGSLNLPPSRILYLLDRVMDKTELLDDMPTDMREALYREKNPHKKWLIAFRGAPLRLLKELEAEEKRLQTPPPAIQKMAPFPEETVGRVHLFPSRMILETLPRLTEDVLNAQKLGRLGFGQKQKNDLHDALQAFGTDLNEFIQGHPNQPIEEWLISFSKNQPQSVTQLLQSLELLRLSSAHTETVEDLSKTGRKQIGRDFLPRGLILLLDTIYFFRNRKPRVETAPSTVSPVPDGVSPASARTPQSEQSPIAQRVEMDDGVRSPSAEGANAPAAVEVRQSIPVPPPRAVRSEVSSNIPQPLSEFVDLCTDTTVLQQTVNYFLVRRDIMDSAGLGPSIETYEEQMNFLRNYRGNLSANEAAQIRRTLPDLYSGETGNLGESINWIWLTLVGADGVSPSSLDRSRVRNAINLFTAFNQKLTAVREILERRGAQ